jgi:internalin A
MSRNRITSLLSLNTPRLKYLNVSKNRLTRLNGLEMLTNLNILLATSNQLLTTIGLQGCTHLLHIDVSDNHLVEMEQLDQCPLLITMKGTSNALIQIPNLFNAILLNELDLSSNSLNLFDELSIGLWLPFLTHLRLANNSLQELSMIKLPALIELDLAFNQISGRMMREKKKCFNIGFTCLFRYINSETFNEILSIVISC